MVRTLCVVRQVYVGEVGDSYKRHDLPEDLAPQHGRHRPRSSRLGTVKGEVKRKGGRVGSVRGSQCLQE